MANYSLIISVNPSYLEHCICCESIQFGTGVNAVHCIQFKN